MTRSPFSPPRRGHFAARAFSISHARWNAPPLPSRKPVGAFRGGLFGFLTGAVVAGASVYWYILGNYRIANEMLSEDITALQSATLKLQSYIKELEDKVDRLHKK
ncbi:hypothetical protein N7474_003220 [Penicillium riverlandense]|uniref:uncharacterized protein n=1 Tax=Penicillium riverlandense TaxID=1903569 RepID=UPI0025488A9C|nr:uncharacterized protein N7474_003220 [Penicillium riverlandense]KAJ5826082.1 hypothetical protein N7474_003220 [Penicillium riverlandense]